jgi:Flp pilus assembly protein TadG
MKCLVWNGRFSFLRRWTRQAFGASYRVVIDKAGSIAVEFALMVPVVLAALFGVIDIGRLIYTQAELSFAVEQATRFAVVRVGEASDEDIEAYAETQLHGIDRVPAIFTSTGPVDSVTNTRLITVRATYDFNFILPLLPDVTIPLSAESTGFLAFSPNVAPPSDDD